MKKRTAAPPVPLSESALRETALAALGRRALTRVELKRRLERAIAMWARRAARAGTGDEEVARAVAQAKAHIEPIVARFVEVRLVDDASFAASRAARLVRAGRSRRAIEAHLYSKGIDGETARSVVPTDRETELRAALALAKRKRLGPFAREEARSARNDALEHGSARDGAHGKALAAFGRAGFDFDVAERALRMPRDEAEERLSQDPRGSIME
jgi:regulatory protein